MSVALEDLPHDPGRSGVGHELPGRPAALSVPLREKAPIAKGRAALVGAPPCAFFAGRPDAPGDLLRFFLRHAGAGEPFGAVAAPAVEHVDDDAVNAALANRLYDALIALARDLGAAFLVLFEHGQTDAGPPSGFFDGAALDLGRVALRL